MIRQTVTIRGKRFVMIEETRLRRLESLARKAETQLPPLPPADAKGNRPALDYIRASIAGDHYGATGSGPEPRAVGRVGGAPPGNAFAVGVRKALALRCGPWKRSMPH